MRTVTQKWALISMGFQENFNSKAEIMLRLASPAFLDKFEEGTEFSILPVYVVVEGRPLQLEYHQ